MDESKTTGSATSRRKPAARPADLEAAAILCVRLLGLLLVVLGALLLFGRALEWIPEYDVAFVREFLLAKMTTPVAAVALGLLLWIGSRPIGRLLTRGLERDFRASR